MMVMSFMHANPAPRVERSPKNNYQNKSMIQYKWIILTLMDIAQQIRTVSDKV